MKKILIIGALAGNISDYLCKAKNLGIDHDCLIFIGYKEAKNLNLNKISSNKYSDILVGPLPHKGVGTLKESSLINSIKSKFCKEIKITELNKCNQYKISISAFKDALKNTDFYFENFIN